MIKISQELKLLLQLHKTQSVITRRFDGGLGGLGLTEFLILFQLSQAEDEKLRRIDLANKIGLTASGITRLLAPMEKIGLVKRQKNAQDARVSYVSLAAGGKRKLLESISRAENISEELIPSASKKKVELLTELLAQMHGKL